MDIQMQNINDFLTEKKLKLHYKDDGKNIMKLKNLRKKI
jgi:hypothetical protein